MILCHGHGKRDWWVMGHVVKVRQNTISYWIIESTFCYTWKTTGRITIIRQSWQHTWHDKNCYRYEFHRWRTFLDYIFGICREFTEPVTDICDVMSGRWSWFDVVVFTSDRVCDKRGKIRNFAWNFWGSVTDNLIE